MPAYFIFFFVKVCVPVFKCIGKTEQQWNQEEIHTMYVFSNVYDWFYSSLEVSRRWKNNTCLWLLMAWPEKFDFCTWVFNRQDTLSTIKNSMTTFIFGYFSSWCLTKKLMHLGSFLHECFFVVDIAVMSSESLALVVPLYFSAPFFFFFPGECEKSVSVLWLYIPSH